MPILFKDDTINQNIVDEIVTIDLKWDTIAGFGLKQQDSVLGATPTFVQLVSRPIGQISDMLYTPPFSVSNNHRRQY